jgi:hypothetical protein
MAKMKQTLEIVFQSDSEDLEINYSLDPKMDEIGPDDKMRQELHLLALRACDEVYQFMKRNIK